LTKWRHPSLNTRSELEITEVEQLEMSPCSDGVYSAEDWESNCARPWTQRETKQKRDKGEVPRWYEAAVISPDAESLFRQNWSLGLGEKTDWDLEALKTSGILSDIYGPALQMVTEMDYVGRNDDNRLSKAYEGLLLRPNDPSRVVPGASYVRGQGGVNRNTVEPW
jgi:hypothetical protein